MHIFRIVTKADDDDDGRLPILVFCYSWQKSLFLWSIFFLLGR